jgi:hypothetical protein
MKVCDDSLLNLEHRKAFVTIYFVPLLCIVQFGEFCGARLILLLVFTMSVFSLFFQYNSKEGSVKLVHEAQPRPRAISAIASKNITKVACGNNHCGLF